MQKSNYKCRRVIIKKYSNFIVANIFPNWLICYCFFLIFSIFLLKIYLIVLNMNLKNVNRRNADPDENRIELSEKLVEHNSKSYFTNHLTVYE